MIYFDNAATTRPMAPALAESTRIYNECYANPASLHSLGVAAESEIVSASKRLAGLLGVSPAELIYTSGGTEANNLALFGACAASRRRHIITTRIEHPSVAEVFRHLEQRGYEVTWLEADAGVHGLAAAVRQDTALVSLMHVNNETGALCDIARAAETVKAKNPSAIFHSDGVQGFGKFKPALKNVDLYSMSAHKIHGLRGIGALYVKKGVRLAPQILGGGQQRGLRSGTENTAGVCGFAAAAEEMYAGMNENHARAALVRSTLAGIADELDGVFINGSPDGSPYILNMSFTGVRAETLLHCLEQDGIYVSTGSACGSKDSHNILRHYGLTKERVESALRFSFSRENTPEQAVEVKRALCAHVSRQRGIGRRG